MIFMKCTSLIVNSIPQWLVLQNALNTFWHRRLDSHHFLHAKAKDHSQLASKVESNLGKEMRVMID